MKRWFRNMIDRLLCSHSDFNFALGEASGDRRLHVKVCVRCGRLAAEVLDYVPREGRLQ